MAAIDWERKFTNARFSETIVGVPIWNLENFNVVLTIAAMNTSSPAPSVLLHWSNTRRKHYKIPGAI